MRQLLCQQPVDDAGVGLALGGLHDPADQGTDGLAVAVPDLLRGVGLLGDHLVDDPLEFVGVADLGVITRQLGRGALPVHDVSQDFACPTFGEGSVSHQ